MRPVSSPKLELLARPLGAGVPTRSLIGAETIAAHPSLHGEAAHERVGVFELTTRKLGAFLDRDLELRALGGAELIRTPQLHLHRGALGQLDGIVALGTLTFTVDEFPRLMGSSFQALTRIRRSVNLGVNGALTPLDRGRASGMFAAALRD